MRARRRLTALTLLLAGAAVVLALTRPSIGTSIPAERATVFVALDQSGSMVAEDLKPNRTRAAAAVLHTFIEDLPADQSVGLIAFSSEAQLAVPPTTDRTQIDAMLDRFQPQGATAMGNAIELALPPRPLPELTSTAGRR